MKIRDLFETWQLKKVTIKAGFANWEWQPGDADKDAAWCMYIELITRVTTVPLSPLDGDEVSALNSVYQLFPLTREILKTHGRSSVNFSRIAVIILNEVIRPFTAHWHPRANTLGGPGANTAFREDLKNLQIDLNNYCGMLAEIAGVESFGEKT
ncbi:MAG: hypothetical protein KUG79_12625 [Pseudomonadales bacterium]|nr:hypothetical protein [Pseudomonadales bacterium]